MGFSEVQLDDGDALDRYVNRDSESNVVPEEKRQGKSAIARRSNWK